MKTQFYYMKKSGDVEWLYIAGETVIKKWHRPDTIIYSKYNKEKDETTIKVKKA